jgi:molybdate transport system substrate-binding protein
MAKVLKFFLLAVSIILFSCEGEKKQEITILAAAGLKPAFERIVAQYNKEHSKVEVNVIYAGSGELLSYLESGKGDVFIPASDYYMDRALGMGLVIPSTVRVVAYHTPVLVVSQSAQGKIKTIFDLTKEGVRVGIGDPKAAAIGKVSVDIFKKAGIWPEVSKNIVVKTPTVNQLLIYLTTQQIDASLVWKELTKNLQGVKVIEIPSQYNEIKTVQIAVSKNSKDKKLAEEFENFVLQHRDIFKEEGFSK